MLLVASPKLRTTSEKLREALELHGSVRTARGDVEQAQVPLHSGQAVGQSRQNWQ